MSIAFLYDVSAMLSLLFTANLYVNDGFWRKLKGFATVRLSDGTVRPAEIHWYEASGIGRKRMKIKHFLD